MALLALTAVLFGCAAPARHAALARPPAPVPQPAQRALLGGLPAAPPPHALLVPPKRPAVDVLIESFERDLAEGEKAYRSNQPAAARRYFDDAINRLMASGFRFNSDPRLEPLMDRLINTMHDYELKFEQAGGQAAETSQEQVLEAEQEPGEPAEPTSPIEEIAEAASPSSNPMLNERAASELLRVPHDLPITVNDQVLTFVNFFQTPRGRKIIERSLARAGRYEPMVQRVLKQEGLPEDLMYLPLSESGYQPRAVSREGARGLWQFMPGTGRLYGLEINRWEDQRMDPVAATRAAAEHLRDLYAIFHDWYLVLAAYDSGALTVARAVERTGYADFWQLYRMNVFVSETRNYVPIMLAITLVAKDPELYGVHVTDPETPVPTDSFHPGRSIDLRLVSDATGTPLDSLRDLNPELFGVVTPDDPSFLLYVPAGTLDQLQATLASVPPTRWVGFRLHRVAPGDTLAAIAESYHVRPAALLEANDLSAPNSLAPGALLFVPAPVMPATILYRVRSGDTLGAIARRYHVTTADLRLWNHIRSNFLRVRQPLRIYTREGVARYEPVSGRRRTLSSRERRRARGSAAAASREIHLARRGETLWSISRRYGVSVESLLGANPGLAGRGLEAGDRIVIP